MGMSGLVSVVVLLFSSFVWAAPAQVLIIRHAEKPESGDELSSDGWKRAYALVSYFKSNLDVTQYGAPVAIYAAGLKPDGSGAKRSIQTVTPLAVELGLTIHQEYQHDRYDAMIREIKSNPHYEGKMVLVCWSHKYISDMAHSFGVTPQPDKWPDSVFDGVWEIDFTGDSVREFREFSQKLFPSKGASW